MLQLAPLKRYVEILAQRSEPVVPKGYLYIKGPLVSLLAFTNQN